MIADRRAIGPWEPGVRLLLLTPVAATRSLPFGAARRLLMGIVKETLLEETTRPKVVDDCALLVDGEVAAKRGVTGFMIKGGYKAFKALKPRIVKDAVEHLLDDFTVIIDDHYEEYLTDHEDKSVGFDSWARRRDQRIAEDLLGVTDRMMERSTKTAIKKIYKSLRGVAKRNVSDAIPAVGRLVVKHVG
jgi:hypothetical protein